MDCSVGVKMFYMCIKVSQKKITTSEYEFLNGFMLYIFMYDI